MAETEEGSRWLKELYELFAPARESLRGYTEQEITDAIDEAVKEVRANDEPDAEIDALIQEMMARRRQGSQT